MKQKRFVSVIGAVALLASAVMVMASCQQPNGPKNDTGTWLGVKPTGKADPAVKGTQWEGEGEVLAFAEDGNIAHYLMFEMLYTISGNTITFDLKESIKIEKNITLEQYLARSREYELEHKAKVEDQIKKESDPKKKKELEKTLEVIKKALEMYKNPTPEEKKEFEKYVAFERKTASVFESNAIFTVTGTFDSEKTELTIEKFPVYNWEKEEVIVKKMVLKKMAVD